MVSALGSWRLIPKTQVVWVSSGPNSRRPSTAMEVPKCVLEPSLTPVGLTEVHWERLSHPFTRALGSSFGSRTGRPCKAPFCRRWRRRGIAWDWARRGLNSFTFLYRLPLIHTYPIFCWENVCPSWSDPGLFRNMSMVALSCTRLWLQRSCVEPIESWQDLSQEARMVREVPWLLSHLWFFHPGIYTVSLDTKCHDYA